jgi:tetratricopeptide (TPR) repeat protein
VASPLPRGEIHARQIQLEQAERLLDNSVDVQIEYLPALALAEEHHILLQQLEARSRDELLMGAARPYERLVREIVARNPAAPENLLIEGDELRLLGRWREALAHYDEVEDRYGKKGPEELVRQAQLGKARAQALGLSPVKARNSLAQLVKAKREEPIGWEELAEIAHGFLATSRASILLNCFADAVSDAHEAVRLASLSRVAERHSAEKGGSPPDRLPERAAWGAEQQALLATCELFYGQALSLCEEWTESCQALERATQIYGALGTRPLLDAIACTELARSRIGAMRLAKAREAVGRAEALLEPEGQPRDGGEGRIVSSYVRARVLQANAEVAAEEGRGVTALRDLVRALGEFQILLEEVGGLEVTVAIFSLVRLVSNQRKRLREEAAGREDWWLSWSPTERHRVPPRLLARMGLLWSMRGLPGPPAPQQQRLPNLGKTLSLLVELQQVRSFLAVEKPSPDHWLRKIGSDQLARHADLPLEAKHELLLLKVLWAVACDSQSPTPQPDPLDPLRALRRHADFLAREKMVRREAQARLVLALAEHDRLSAQTTLKQLYHCLEKLESPRDWAWNLPVEFVSSAPGLAKPWHRISPHLDAFWPPQSSPGRAPQTS